MDSGNSSSMQSSSCGGGPGGGGEEEYDSRAADHSISAFLNHHHNATSRNLAPTGQHHLINVGDGGGLIPDPPPLPPHHQTHLDPLMANYFAANNHINLDMVWSSSSPPKPGNHRPDLAGLDLTSPAPPSQQPFFTNPQRHQVIIRPPNSTITSSGQIGGDQDNNNGNNSKNNNNNHTASRNPKKRSRASRRAPTTVLTTDTTNFRAMVQEFTGIPAPPFTGSSTPFPRNHRFDLFGSSSSSFPLKPFAQKLIAPTASFFSSSSTIAAASCSSSSMGYCIPSMESQNLVNTHTQSISNPILNIQNPKNPLEDLSVLTSKSKALFDPSDQTMKMACNVHGVGEFGHVGTNFGGLQNIVSSPSTSALVHRNEINDAKNGRVDLLRPIGGSNFGESLHRAASYRATVAATAAPENNLAAARNEGMVESWICSSD